MIVIDSTRQIVNVNSLTEDQRSDYNRFFEENGKDLIIDLGDRRFITYKTLSENREPVDICVDYGPDMFLMCQLIVNDNEFAIAVDGNGNYKGVLKLRASTYYHYYTYTGEADMWFLDEYSCLFLVGCNEYSVELCQMALSLWQGSRLVLVGEDWEDMIEYLPDLPGIECFYEPVLNREEFNALIEGHKYLSVVEGYPHAETMDRYEAGTMYYDEVMSFTFMFTDRRELGEKNPDKKFFVMDGYFGTLGLFALFNKMECCLRYAKSRGFIPVACLTKARNSMYSNKEGEDIWSKIYNQPEEYSLKEVMESKNVFFSPGFYNGSIQSELMNRKSEGVSLTWPNGIYNDDILDYINEREKRFLPYPDQTLGILVRGTDYAKTNLHNHALHATPQMICDKIKEVKNTWVDFKYIYLATEDEEYCNFFKDHYGDKIFFTDQKRFVTKENELLYQHHVNAEEKRDGFLLAAEYILSIYLLSKCRSLIASGGCGGVDEAISQNDGRYENIFVFNLGVNQ